MVAIRALWFDREALVEEYGGRVQDLGTLLRCYLQEGPHMLAALSAAVAQGDADRVGLMAHLVTGELLRLHARPVAAVARKIERAAAAGRVQGAGPLLPALEHAMRELLVGLVPLAVWLERETLDQSVVITDDGTCISVR